VKKYLTFLCKIMLAALSLVLIINEVGSVGLIWPTFFLGAAILIVSMPLMERSFRMPMYVLLAASLGIYLFSGLPGEIWVRGTNSMLNVAAIIVVMQLFAVPIQLRRYDDALKFVLVNYFKKESTLFVVVTIVSNLFGSFLLFGTIPVVMSLLSGTLKRIVRHYEHFVATAIPRGQSLIGLWAPGAINILLIMQTTGLSWIELFIPGLVLSLAGLGISRVVEGRIFLSSESLVITEEENEQAAPITKTEAWTKLAGLLIVISSMLLLIIIFEENKFSSSTGRVLLAGAFVVSFLLVFCRKAPGFSQAFAAYWNTGIIKAVDLSGLFISMGIFSAMVEGSQIIPLVQNILPGDVSTFGYLAIVLTTLGVFVCAFVGIHPFISVVMGGSLLMSLPTAMPVLPLALSLTLGTAISYNISPFAGVILTIAKYLDRNPLEIAFKWNGPFSLIFFVVGTILIQLMTNL